jgi:hypothetical protein
MVTNIWRTQSTRSLESRRVVSSIYYLYKTVQLCGYSIPRSSLRQSPQNNSCVAPMLRELPSLYLDRCFPVIEDSDDDDMELVTRLSAPPLRRHSRKHARSSQRDWIKPVTHGTGILLAFIEGLKTDCHLAWSTQNSH